MDKKYKLIRSKFLIPLSRKIGTETRIEDGYLLTEGGLIKEVGKYSPKIGERIIHEYGDKLQIIGAEKNDNYKEKDIICLNGVVLPGFIKAHAHDHETLIKGIAKDECLTDWLDHSANVLTRFLDNKKNELKERLDKNPYLLVFLKARLDDIYYGITSTLNHLCNASKYNGEDVIEANTIAGTKMVLAVGSQDRNQDPYILSTPEEEVKRLNDLYNAFGNKDRIWVIPGPNEVFSNSAEMLKELKQWARDHNTLFHVHSSEEPRTTAWFYEQYDMSPTQYLYNAGILDENTIIAHQVNNTPIDLALLKKTGAKVAHNPLANTILGSGMPPIIEMLEKGIQIAIGTDGLGSSDDQNILAAARLVSQYQKAYHKDASLLPAQQVLEMITVIPAEMLKLNAGSLDVGKDADFIVIDITRPNLVPTRVDNVVENLIWSSNGSEVRWVVVDGKILKDDYKIITLDEDEIKDNIQYMSELLIEYKKMCPEIRASGARQAI